MQPRRCLSAHADIVHPGAAALVFTRKRIQVEAGDALSVPQQPEKLYIRVPDRHRLIFLRSDTEELLHHGEHPLEYFREGEVGAQLFLAHGIAALLELFRCPGNIPRLQFVQRQGFTSERLQLRKFALRSRPCARGQILEKSHYLSAVRRHLAGDGQLGVILHPQQVGLLCT